MTTALSHEPSRVDAPISDFDPYAEDALDNPYPHYEVLRELGPIVHLQRYGVYAIARHAEIDAVLRDHGAATVRRRAADADHWPRADDQPAIADPR